MNYPAFTPGKEKLRIYRSQEKENAKRLCKFFFLSIFAHRVFNFDTSDGGIRGGAGYN
jgi:hypothetical protein